MSANVINFPAGGEQVAPTADRVRELIATGDKNYIEAGRLLLDVKKKLGHGTFGAWLKASRIAPRTAQLCMQMAAGKTTLAQVRERNRAAKERQAQKRMSHAHLPEAPDDDDENPENFTTAFFLRADQAIRFATYAGPVTGEVIAMARFVREAWATLEQQLERTRGRQEIEAQNGRGPKQPASCGSANLGQTNRTNNAKFTQT